MSNKQEILYGLCMVAVALQLSAICTENWSVDPQDIAGVKLDASLGLWKACGDISVSDGTSVEAEACLHLPVNDWKSFPTNSLYAARAFSILGVMLVFMGLVSMMYMKGRKRFQLVCVLLGGLCSVVANIVWASDMFSVVSPPMKGAQLKKLKMKPGYSFYLNLVGGLVSLVSAAYLYYA